MELPTYGSSANLQGKNEMYTHPTLQHQFSYIICRPGSKLWKERRNWNLLGQLTQRRPAGKTTAIIVEKGVRNLKQLRIAPRSFGNTHVVPCQ